MVTPSPKPSPKPQLTQEQRDKAIEERAAKLKAQGKLQPMSKEETDRLEGDLYREDRRILRETDPLKGCCLRLPTKFERFRIKLAKSLGMKVLMPKWYRKPWKANPAEDLRKDYSGTPMLLEHESTG